MTLIFIVVGSIDTRAVAQATSRIIHHQRVGGARHASELCRIGKALMPAVKSMSVPMVDEAVVTMEALRFLSDGNRLRILQVLSRRESCVCDLIDQLGQPQPLISYHLRRLREAGLVRPRRQAQWVYYSIDAEAWERFTRPIRFFCDPAELPLAAAYGASDACDTRIPSSLSGASNPGAADWPE